MSSCKTLIRSSVSFVEFRAPSPNSTILRHLSLHSVIVGLRFKTYKAFSISRSFGCVRGPTSSLHAFDCLDDFVDPSRTPEFPNKDNVEELLSKNKDDVVRLMKMERRPENYHEHGSRWFPYLNRFKAGDGYLSSTEVLEAIGPYIMDVRKEKFKKAVNNRTYSVCLVVEGLSDLGNVSAAFRSADALGFQSVHVVSCGNSRRYRDNRHVSMGAEKWLDIELWSSVKECFGILKSRGYRIATTHLGIDTVSVYDIDWSCPTAIVVGNELKGISAEALELSDVHCSIPMRGMVDSFNVSVAAGLVMHQAVRDRTLRMGCHGDLTEEERQILLAEFYLRHSISALSIANEFAARKLTRTMSKL